MASDLLTKQLTVYVNEIASIASGLKLAEEMLTKIRNGGSFDAMEYITHLETIRNAADLASSYAREVAHL